MQNFDRKEHWENIYKTREINEVSWYQPNPETSLSFIRKTGIDRSSRIIDIGGGDSFLADHLHELGFENISVRDISGSALKRAQKRLGSAASKVKWIQADVAEFDPGETYDLWHDRAAFHFLTSENEIQSYIKAVKHALPAGGYLIVGTFSEEGPGKCSGIEISRYSQAQLSHRFGKDFETQYCQRTDHQTPSGKLQNFSFCSFQRL